MKSEYTLQDFIVELENSDPQFSEQALVWLKQQSGVTIRDVALAMAGHWIDPPLDKSLEAVHPRIIR